MSVATLAKMVEKSNIEQIDERPYDAVRDSGDGKQQAIFCIPSGTYTGTHQTVWLLPGDQTGYNMSFKDGLLTGILKQVYKKNVPVLNVVEDDASILLSEINSKFF